jgi:GIY-YIG catalytic domain
MVHIYGLAHPITKEIRYIGKSQRVDKRYADHLKDKSKTHKVNWIQSLIRCGLTPELILLEEMPDDGDWIERERFWIADAKGKGWNLVNSTDGGDGVLNLSGDGKRRLLETWKGRKHKPESIEKLKEAMKHRVYQERSKDKLSATMKGRKIEWADKLQVAVRKFDDEKLFLIKSELDNGMKVIDAAKKYGVHRTTVTKIKQGTYKTFVQKTRNSITPRRYMNAQVGNINPLDFLPQKA